jgi:hypothetical protein
MNVGAYKTFVQREKDDVKEFSRIAFLNAVVAVPDIIHRPVS